MCVRERERKTSSVQFNEHVIRTATNDKDASGASFDERVSIKRLSADAFVGPNYQRGASKMYSTV